MKEILGEYTEDMKLADLHVHTNRSRDGLLTPRQVVDLAVASGLQVIAITDHNCLSSFFEAEDYRRQKRYDNLTIIPGTEVTTRDGHLIALKVVSDISIGRGISTTLLEIHRQGGIAIAPHPFYRLLQTSLREDKIIEVLQSDDPGVYFDCFEAFNDGVFLNPRSNANSDALSFYQEHTDNLGAAIGSSDRHRYTIGGGLTGFHGDIFEAIRSRQTTVLMLEKEERIKAIELAVKMFGDVVLQDVSRLRSAAIKRFT